MSTKHAYDAHVYRKGDWWMIEIPELDALTQARRWMDVEDQAISLAAAMTNAKLSEVSVRISHRDAP